VTASIYAHCRKLAIALFEPGLNFGLIVILNLILFNFGGYRQLKNSKFWLLSVAAGLIVIHLTLTWRTNSFNLLSNSVLFWLAVSSLVWKKRNFISLESGVFSSCLGASLIASVLVKSMYLTGGYFLHLSPFISALGLALLASGFKELKQYWQELITLFFIGGSYVLLPSLFDPSLLTAKLATFILWYSGFEVSRSGININLLTGGLEVYSSCSGMESITYLLGIAVLFLVIFPISRVERIFVLIVAVSVALIVNGLRVALMTVLAASSKAEAFEYWYEGDGSLIFSLLTVLLFVCFCLFLLQEAEAKPRN